VFKGRFPYTTDFVAGAQKALALFYAIATFNFYTTDHDVMRSPHSHKNKITDNCIKYSNMRLYFTREQK